MNCSVNVFYYDFRFCNVRLIQEMAIKILFVLLALTLVHPNPVTSAQTAPEHETISSSMKYSVPSNAKHLEYNCETMKDLPTYGDISELCVELVNCSDVPVGLFVNSWQLHRLTISTQMATCCRDTWLFVNFPAHTLDGLGNLTELRLQGFESLKQIEPSSLTALKVYSAYTWMGLAQTTCHFTSLPNFFGISQTLQFRKLP